MIFIIEQTIIFRNAHLQSIRNFPPLEEPMSYLHALQLKLPLPDQELIALKPTKNTKVINTLTTNWNPIVNIIKPSFLPGHFPSLQTKIAQIRGILGLEQKGD